MFMQTLIMQVIIIGGLTALALVICVVFGCFCCLMCRERQRRRRHRSSINTVLRVEDLVPAQPAASPYQCPQPPDYAEGPDTPDKSVFPPAASDGPQSPGHLPAYGQPEGSGEHPLSQGEPQTRSLSPQHTSQAQQHPHASASGILDHTPTTSGFRDETTAHSAAAAAAAFPPRPGPPPYRQSASPPPAPSQSTLTAHDLQQPACPEHRGLQASSCCSVHSRSLDNNAAHAKPSMYHQQACPGVHHSPREYSDTTTCDTCEPTADFPRRRISPSPECSVKGSPSRCVGQGGAFFERWNQDYYPRSCPSGAHAPTPASHNPAARPHSPACLAKHAAERVFPEQAHAVGYARDYDSALPEDWPNYSHSHNSACRSMPASPLQMRRGRQPFPRSCQSGECSRGPCPTHENPPHCAVPSAPPEEEIEHGACSHQATPAAQPSMGRRLSPNWPLNNAGYAVPPSPPYNAGYQSPVCASTSYLDPPQGNAVGYPNPPLPGSAGWRRPSPNGPDAGPGSPPPCSMG